MIDGYHFYEFRKFCLSRYRKHEVFIQSRVTVKPAATFINTLNTLRLKNLYYARMEICRGSYFIVLAILRYNALVIMRRSRTMQNRFRRY